MDGNNQRQQSNGSYAPWRRTGQVKQSFMKSMVCGEWRHLLPVSHLKKIQWISLIDFQHSQGWTDQTLLQTIDRNNSQQCPEPVQELDESPFKSNNKHSTNNNPDKQSNAIKLPSQCCANCFCDCKARYFSSKSGPQANKENASSMTTTAAENVASKLIKEGKMPPKCSKQRNCMITGGVELVPLLAKRRAMQRPITLSTTDVTKYPTERK